MRFFLDVFEFIAAILLIYALVQIVSSFKVASKKERTFYEAISDKLLKHFKTVKIIPVIAIIILGAYNFVHRTFCPVLRVGALYEPTEYTQQYEAELIYEDLSVPCIAQIQCVTHRDEPSSYKRYYLYKLEVPGGQKHDIDFAECSWNNKTKEFEAYVWIGDAGALDCDFDVLINVSKIADSSSKDKLLSYSFHEYSTGCYVSSKNSDVLHCESCRYVRQITHDDIMRFDCIAEAIAAGYWRPCDTCGMNL